MFMSRAVPNRAAFDEGEVAGAGGEPAASHVPIAIPPDGAGDVSTSPPADPFAQRREETRALLLASAPCPSAAESILYDLASREIAVYVELSEAQEKLARDLSEAVTGEIRAALALSKVLREVTQISGAIGRRVEHILGTAASVRAQRRFLELHRGRDET